MKEETCLAFENARFIGRHIFEQEDHHLYQMSVAASAHPSPEGEIVECRWFTPQELGNVAVKPTNVQLLKLHGMK